MFDDVFNDAPEQSGKTWATTLHSMIQACVDSVKEVYTGKEVKILKGPYTGRRAKIKNVYYDSRGFQLDLIIMFSDETGYLARSSRKDSCWTYTFDAIKF